MVQRIRDKEQKKQHINGTKKTPLKDCTTEVVQKYDHKSSGRLDSDAT